MDFPVEATVDLYNFPNELEARRVLQSHGFTMKDLSRNRVRVKGSFFALKAAKASLEQLLLSSQSRNTERTVAQRVSSGAIPKRDTNRSYEGSRGRSASRKTPPPPYPSSPTGAPSWVPNSSRSPPVPAGPDRRGSITSGAESFVIDEDVFRYAERLRKKDMDGILDSHNVGIEVRDVSENYNITIRGKSAKTAAFKLQSLLSDLNTSLRTQEVLMKDMDREGQVLLDRIRKNRNVHNSVLVCQQNDRLHLIGTSGESYELKQRLLGRQVDQSGRRGRTLDRNSPRRSSSLPPINRRSTDRDNGATAYPRPAGAKGYSPQKYEDKKPSSGISLWRRRSQSETRKKPLVERNNVDVREIENKRQNPKSPIKFIQNLMTFSPNTIKKQLKSKRRSK